MPGGDLALVLELASVPHRTVSSRALWPVLS